MVVVQVRAVMQGDWEIADHCSYSLQLQVAFRFATLLIRGTFFFFFRNFHSSSHERDALLSFATAPEHCQEMCPCVSFLVLFPWSISVDKHVAHFFHFFAKQYVSE